MSLSHDFNSQDLRVSYLLFLEQCLFVAKHDRMKRSEFKCIKEGVIIFAKGSIKWGCSYLHIPLQWRHSYGKAAAAAFKLWPSFMSSQLTSRKCVSHLASFFAHFPLFPVQRKELQEIKAICPQVAFSNGKKFPALSFYFDLKCLYNVIELISPNCIFKGLYFLYESYVITLTTQNMNLKQTM